MIDSYSLSYYAAHKHISFHDCCVLQRKILEILGEVASILSGDSNGNITFFLIILLFLNIARSLAIRLKSKKYLKNIIFLVGFCQIARERC